MSNRLDAFSLKPESSNMHPLTSACMDQPAFAPPFDLNYASHRRGTKTRLLCSHAPPAHAERRTAGPKKMPPIFFVLGGPGSGKGTQCNFLKREYDVEQICVGDLLRQEATRSTALGKSINNIMQKGEIVPGEVTMALLKKELAGLADACEGVLIDGFPRAMDQAHDFEEKVGACEFVLYFHCTRQEMIKRLLNRGKTSGRADDVEDTVTRRLSTFETKTLPVVEHFRKRGLLREIDSSNETPLEIYEKTRMMFQHAFS